ncbi:MAG: tRNA-specific 2-thiouridylase MnmA [Candidatus Kapaibacterium sp.]|nr:MAG: tRNA-specific 2-thiouridylase MnmA [Candidatus Kapabacteria bacterium]
MVKNKKRVLVGMSGGVDSSTAAAILKAQGYEVVGITVTSIKITDDCKVENSNSGCCNYQALIDASDIAEHLGIEHHIVDLSDIFKEKIINNFVEEYLKGRTPNPCSLCNPLIKWGEILKKADEYDCQFYATGHYARLEYDKRTGRYYIRMALDKTKDQSYFLWGLNQEQLKRTIFPLGNLLKSQVRELAREFGLKVHNKFESQEICFVPSNNYRDVLEQYSNQIDLFKEGNILFRGVVVGKHNGYVNYTIGQRRGLGISYHQPLYVKKIIPETNTIVVDIEEELKSYSLSASNINLMKYDNLDENKEYLVKIRYKDKGSKGICKVLDNGVLNVQFIEPKKAITPGQSVVVYENEDLVAGGIIDGNFEE